MKEYKDMLDEFERNENMVAQLRMNNINNNINKNENYINNVSLSNIRNFLFSLRVINNILSYLERFVSNSKRINTNSFSRNITRYQKYPLCCNIISESL